MKNISSNKKIDCNYMLDKIYSLAKEQANILDYLKCNSSDGSQFPTITTKLNDIKNNIKIALEHFIKEENVQQVPQAPPNTAQKVEQKNKKIIEIVRNKIMEATKNNDVKEGIIMMNILQKFLENNDIDIEKFSLQEMKKVFKLCLDNPDFKKKLENDPNFENSPQDIKGKIFIYSFLKHNIEKNLQYYDVVYTPSVEDLKIKMKALEYYI